MTNRLAFAALILSSCGLCTFPALAQHQHEGDVIIGHTGDLPPQLAVEAPGEPATLLPVAPGFPIAGWSADEPGFEALEEDEPNEEFYRLAAGAQVWLRILSLDGGLHMFDQYGSELLPGTQWYLGDHELHGHGLFMIYRGENGNPALTPATALFEVADTGTTAYETSAPFAITFVPEPATLALLVLGGLAVAGRTRARRAWVTGLGVLGLALATAVPAHAQHTGDLWLAASGDGQLKLGSSGFVPDGTGDAVVVLSPAGGPLLYGWTSNNPGFDDIITADPNNDTYPLADGAVIWLEVLAKDAALMVWDVQFHHYEVGGAPARLGAKPGDIHAHLIWHIDSNYPDFEQLFALTTHWRATFRLLDTGGTGYTPSEPFDMIFSNVSCKSGDVNNDAIVDNFDINPFVGVLIDPESATAQQRCAADANLDGTVDNFDINPFVALLIG